ncbi:MAG: c-type cytochrome [Gemmataceae bacterium]
MTAHCSAKWGMVALAAVVVVSGCDPSSYPTDLRYPARTDPIPKEVFPEQLAYPDRPGQFPLMSVAQLPMTFTEYAYPHPAFNLTTDKFIDPLGIDAGARGRLQATLEQLFGTPAAPQVAALDEDVLSEMANYYFLGDPEGAANAEKYGEYLQELKLDRDTLARGSVLYRLHCLQCHGLPGDGRGATSRWVNPHPRDYRVGAFKFISTAKPMDAAPWLNTYVSKPRRDDLYRVIDKGIEGTSMPAFNLVTPQEIDDMVSYVIHLSLRGQVELAVLRDLDRKEIEPGEVAARARGYLALFVVRDWAQAQTPPFLVRPKHPKPEYPAPLPPNADDAQKAAYDQQLQAYVESVRQGQVLFNLQDPKDPEGGCFACHSNYGKQSSYRFDAWGTLVRPANLTKDVYRGGRRPIDLYWRIYAGILPGGMPGFPNLAAGERDQIWDIVNFLEAMPYPDRLKECGVAITSDPGAS